MVCPTRRLRVGQDDDHPLYGARDDGHTAHWRRGPQQGPGYARRRLLDRQNQPPRQPGRSDDRQRLPPPPKLPPVDTPRALGGVYSVSCRSGRQRAVKAWLRKNRISWWSLRGRGGRRLDRWTRGCRFFGGGLRGAWRCRSTAARFLDSLHGRIFL